MTDVLSNLSRFWPEVALTVAILAVVLVDASGIPERHRLTHGLAVAGLLAAGGLLFIAPASLGPSWGGMLATDAFSAFFKALLIGATLLVLLAFTFRNSRELAGLGQGEFHALMLAATLANVLLASANDLLMLYLSLEMLSLTSYVLVAYMKGDRMSNEASLKYILFGAVSTGVMLYGLTLLYGMAGTSSFSGVREALSAGLTAGETRTATVAVLLVIAGFGFKTASVPFHFWCPDVYQGAPTPVTAFLSVAPKAAGFAIMTRFFFSGLAVREGEPWALTGLLGWQGMLMLISVVTMTVGNVAALTQTNMKRLLAYSSIAHAGYIMMGVVALSENGARGLIVYLLAYLVMNLGAFLVVMLIHQETGSFDLRDYGGMYHRAPFLTLAMAVFLFSLMGIPPLVGFMGKLYVFAAIVEKGPAFWWYALAGAVNAAVAAYYYARVLKTMIIDADEEARPALTIPALDQAWVAAFALANLLPLLFWSRIEAWAKASLVLYAGR